MDGSTIWRLACGPDVRPDGWQLALADGVWPRVLVAPTGAGKTAAVTLGWAAHRLRNPDATPRRLVWCLPMRALVEQTARRVAEWFGRLAAAANAASRLPGPEDVHVLMGGVDAGGWLAAPERPAVLVGTQDMLLSRALMRGYASSRALWPMEFALLHEDAQWVFDEVQLMGAGRATSAQLEAFRRGEAARAARTGRPPTGPARPSRSLWISATLDPRWLATVDHAAPPPDAVVRVDPAAEADGRLALLSRAAKTLVRSRSAPASSKKADVTSYVERLAAEILCAHRPGRMTLAVVNRVQRAQALHAALEKSIAKRAQPAPTLALVHSRFRPADRRREMEKVVSAGEDDPRGRIVVATSICHAAAAAAHKEDDPRGRIVVATQAVEAGVDVSAAVLFTEVAPWSSLVQRFGRANRYAELRDGADVRWIDLLRAANGGAAAEKDAEELAIPYRAAELRAARGRLAGLTDAAPVHLPAADDVEPPRRVVRRKDVDDLFDTDPDLTGFDVDVSPYVRDADDTDVRLFWRDLSAADDVPPRPRREELCAVSIGAARKWLREIRSRSKGKALVFQRDPQWRRGDGRAGTTPAGWTPFRDEPWPGLILLADRSAGGYRETVGFTGDPRHVPDPAADPPASGETAAAGPPDGAGSPAAGETAAAVGRRRRGGEQDGADSPAADETEGHDEDPLSEIDTAVPLAEHLRHVTAEAEALCEALGVDADTRAAVTRAARWHDLGKAHEVFQDTMRRGLDGRDAAPDVLLAKTIRSARHRRAYFRHELASALAFLAHEGWSRDGDLVAYLIAAHHGKVRMNLRALPRESAPRDGDRAGARFARGVREGDELPPFDLNGGERWPGGRLTLSIMELGWDEVTRESWTERTRELLARLGPFRLAWLETLLRAADWRASAKERRKP